MIYCDDKLRALTKKKKVGQPGIISAIAKNLKDIKTEKKKITEASKHKTEKKSEIEQTS